MRCRHGLFTVCLVTDCCAGGFCTSEPGGALTNFAVDIFLGVSAAGIKTLQVSTEEMDTSHCARVHYLSPSINGRMGSPPFLPEDHVKIQLG